VVAVGKHRSSPPPICVDPEHRIDIPGSRNLESLHPARKGELVLCLHQHVNMRPLNADVHDPHPFAQRRNDRRVTHGLVERASTHVPDNRHDAHHDMQRVARLDGLSLLVR
jgi:hypothetical protein